MSHLHLWLIFIIPIYLVLGFIFGIEAGFYKNLSSMNSVSKGFKVFAAIFITLVSPVVVAYGGIRMLIAKIKGKAIYK